MKNIAVKLIIINIVLGVLALAVALAIELSPHKDSPPVNPKVEGVEEQVEPPVTPPTSEETPVLETTNEEAPLDGNKYLLADVKVDESRSKVDIGGQIYSFNEIPAIKIGDKFSIMGATEPLATVEVLVGSIPVTYTTKANGDGEWEVEVDTTMIGIGSHTFITEITPQDRLNGKVFNPVAFSVKAQEVEVTEAVPSQDILKILTSPPYVFILIGLLLFIILLIVTLLLKKKKNPKVKTPASESAATPPLKPIEELHMESSAKEAVARPQVKQNAPTLAELAEKEPKSSVTPK